MNPHEITHESISVQVAEVTLIGGGPYAAENFVDAVRRLGDVAKAHDMLHPDRDVCGGLVGCVVG